MLYNNIFFPFFITTFAIIAVYIYIKYYHHPIGVKGKNTTILDTLSVDFTKLAEIGKIDPVIGREDEVQKLARILSRRNKNNAILVGSPGVGKTAIVEGLAQRIVKKDVPRVLIGKRIISLDVAALFSGTKYRGELEQRAKRVIQEIISANRSIILFVDEIHTLVQSHGSEGAINFTDILKPALARGELQMIGATTFFEYDKYIKQEESFARRFQLINIIEATEKDALEILKNVKDKYSEYHKVEFTDAALETAVKLSQKLIKNRQLPDKAIDAIDEAAAMVRVSHIHETMPGILYQAAVLKYPEIAEIWRKIQEIDKRIYKLSFCGDKKQLDLRKNTILREQLEDQLRQRGLLIVDLDDVEKTIVEWLN